jgi:two-component system chemotaxis sensor kinase CheA
MIDEDGIAVFRVEAEELLGQIEQGLLDLAHNPEDQELVGTVFRALHTLKGSGAMFGFDDLASFTHHCETAFDLVRKGEVPASRALITAVLNAMDHMRALAEKRPVGPHPARGHVPGPFPRRRGHHLAHPLHPGAGCSDQRHAAAADAR